ncbi:conserved hypothetical protein [Thioalkalivibrio sp. K90mix]|uniref:hypothetical protein n=1 Tax=unclassified Thioalkalivibrio TaxID=2621013 RepID=UPI000195AABD|nr:MULTISPECIES: hypothetical protein [unclassified Thioalkalivibrio]ADC71820.1 conserved hypothetical protein [Thioalkalivibrio sp. K90mix]
MYVRRDAEGRIDLVSRDANAECAEFMAAESPELLGFLAGNNAEPAPAALQASDLELIRVLEDLVEVLTYKGVIRFTDLPDAAQQKLLGRKDLRASARRLNLMEDDEGLL